MIGSGGGDGSGGGEMSVLERQQAQTKWRQQQRVEHPPEPQLLQQHQILNYLSGQSDQLIGIMLSPQAHHQQFQGLITCDDQNFMELLSVGIKQDPSLDNGWNDLGTIGANAFIGSETMSCQPSGKNKATSSLPENPSFKKRKTDKSQSLKAVTEEESKDRTEQADNKKTFNKSDSKKEHSMDTSNQTSKVTEEKKPDYIHVRARRGQATDSHSLAERVRREKISERMKYLQDLVPGCNKITGKAGMLDEIINYVQSLQKQVEFLSMKLAAVNPRLDFNIDSLLNKEMFQSSTSNFPQVGITSEMVNPSNLHLNLLQLVSSSGLEIGISPSDTALQRTASVPVSMDRTLLSSASINQVQTSPTWDVELQNLYAMEVQQGRPTSFTSQPFMGFVEGGNPRMEI